MKILITGGAGFIGSNLSLYLVNAGHEVTVLDSLSPQIHGIDPGLTSPLYKSLYGKVRFELGSVCDRTALMRVLPNQDAIIHLAAETGTGQSMYEIKRYVDVNVSGTALLLDLLANSKHQVQKVVVASSRSIYGEGKYWCETHGTVYPGARKESDLKGGRFEPLSPTTGKPMAVVATDECSKLHPSSVYGITKQSQEQMVMVVCKSLNIKATALRYQNVYGPGQSLSNPYTGILSIFSTRIFNQHEINIFEDGKESRDFVFIDDVVQATYLALIKEEANGEVFGIGSGVATDVLTIAKKLVQNYEISVPIHVTGSYRAGDIRHNFADLKKPSKLLGYEPKVSLVCGLEQFTKWAKVQQVQTDTYEESMQEMKTRGLLK